jgi:hypothetical protein
MQRLEIHLLASTSVVSFVIDLPEDVARIVELVRKSKGTATPMVSVTVNDKTSYIDANYVTLMQAVPFRAG